MGYLILFGWLVLLPICAGGIFSTKKNTVSLSARWLWGQFLLWGIFQIIAVYLILTSATLDDVIVVFVISSLFLGVLGLIYTLKICKNVDNLSLNQVSMWIKSVFATQFHKFKEHKLLSGIFIVLWFIQMIALFILAVNDGDDAFYMAVAERARESGELYTANVYSFGTTGLNYRYAMAPFPIWIAFLSRISGVHTLTIGHVVLGIMLVTMSYVVYAELGKNLFDNNRKKQLLFLIFIAVLYVWGNTSSHTAESFLLLRSRQGKALVAGLVFPAVFALILKIGKSLEQCKVICLQDYFLAAVIILTGCLGSTLGGSLVILLWSSSIFFLAVSYKKWSLLPFGALSAIPGCVFAILYFL